MITELNKTFRRYVFVEDGHTYIDTDTGQELISVTKLLSTLRPKMDTDYWLKYKCLERSGYKVRPVGAQSIEVDGKRFDTLYDNINEYNLQITPIDLKKEWDLAAKVGNTRGTYMHEYLENKFNRRQLKQELPYIIPQLSAHKAVLYLSSLNTLKDLADSFYEDCTGKYTPVATEFIVGDSELGLAGTFDLLLYNNQTGGYEIWDFKTDKKLEIKGRNKIREFNVDDCEINKYSLQLGLYKYILEKNTSIKIDQCVIVHFNYKEKAWKNYLALDYDEKIKSFLTNGNNRSPHI